MLPTDHVSSANLLFENQNIALGLVLKHHIGYQEGSRLLVCFVMLKLTQIDNTEKSFYFCTLFDLFYYAYHNISKIYITKRLNFLWFYKI
jgi:hypothetical protein